MTELPPGIHKLPDGKFRVRVAYGTRKRGGVQKERTFPAGTGLKEMKEWQADTRADLKRADLRPAKGTLEADAPLYIEKVTKRLDFPEDRQSDLKAWFPTFGQRGRHTIKQREVEQQVDDWKSEGVAASTIRHRMTALSMLYQVLDGKAAYNPVKGVERPSEPTPQPDFRSPETILSVLDTLAWKVARQASTSRRPDGPKMQARWQTLARLLVLNYTGTRPSQLMRVDPVNHLVLDGERPMVFIPAGKSGKAHWKPLPPGGVAAFRLFLNVGAAGTFDVNSLHRTWEPACKEAGVDYFNPYKLRHSYATLLRRGGMDLADVQQLLGHTDSKTTARYAAVIPEKLDKAVEAFGRGWSKAGTSSGGVPVSVEKKVG